MSPLIVSPLVIFGACCLCLLAALWIFPRLQLLDFPERYGLTRSRLPYPGGVVPVLLFLSLIAWLLPHTQAIGVALAVAILGTCSFIDDRHRLPAGIRFGVHILCGAIVVGAGMRISAITNPLPGILADQGGSIVLTQGWGLFFSLIFSIGWILLCINAINWFDGIPGQVSLLSTIGFITIGLLSLSSRVAQPQVALLAFMLAALSGACVLFEFPPPKMILGDSGAMFFGFLLALLTIFSGGKVATGFLVLGIPLTDAIIVIVRRLRRGVPVWRGNAHDEHLHHRLLNRGFSPRQVLLLNAAIGSTFGITALFLSTSGKIIACALLILFIISLSAWSKPRPQ